MSDGRGYNDSKNYFLGSGSSFAIGPENYQSNVLLELENDTLLIDAGTDIKYSLRDQGLSYKDIKIFILATCIMIIAVDWNGSL